MKRPQKNGAEPIDEHNQPTEPMNFVVSPYAPTATGDGPATIPASGRPFTQQPASLQPPLIGAYPFLPPTAARQSGYDGHAANAPVPPGGSAPAYAGTKRRRVFPALVGLFFVAIQLALLVRFVLGIATFWNNTDWVNIFFAITAPLIWPMQALLQRIPIPVAATIEISTLLAILAYGLLSRILVRCLKLILRSR